MDSMIDGMIRKSPIGIQNFESLTTHYQLWKIVEGNCR